METGHFGPEYVLLIDLGTSAYSAQTLREHLTLFQHQLKRHQPYVAVPSHPCNTVDSSDGNVVTITSVYETHFVAIHRNAITLLLPLDEELFSLVCHLMLRGTVMQFQFGDPPPADASACQLSDAANQHAMMHMVASLLAEEFVRALPFTPRIQNPSHPPYFFLSSDGSYSADLVDSDACPVLCSFYYWAEHPAFECCLSADAARVESPAFSADAAYAKLAQRWQLPRNHDLACKRLTSENYVTFATKEIKKDLTHPLPKFGLALSVPPITLDNHCSCASDSSLPRAASDVLSRFKLTLQPNELQLQTTELEGVNTLRVRLQIVLSSPEYNHIDSDSSQFKAVFGSIESVHIRTQCLGGQTAAMVDVSHLRIISETDHPRQSAIAPWFYLPSENIPRHQWFEVTSNISRDALRFLIADVSVSTKCDDFMFVSANASVLLREFATAGPPCSCHLVSAESHNVSFSAQEVAARASVLVEDAPDDLFDDGEEAETEGMHSDFACAGPNRGWPWGEQDCTALPKEMSQGYYNMCLFRNICWIEGSLTLYLPESLLPLDEGVPSFFEFKNENALNLAPFSLDDSRRTLW
jgi:hypothetical protein